MSRGSAARGRRTARRKEEALRAAGGKQMAPNEAQTPDQINNAFTELANEYVTVDTTKADSPDNYEWNDIATLAAPTNDGDGNDTEPDNDEPMTGQCACGHMSNAHYGDMNDGACDMAGCDCMAFKPTGPQSNAVDEVERLSYTLHFTATNSNGAWVATSNNTWANWPLTMQMGGQTFELTPDQIRPADPVGTVLPSGTIQWTALLAPEGQATDDGRIFAPGSIEWRTLPLSLMGMTKTADGHDGAEVCGRIDQIWRDSASGLVMGQGEFDTGDFGSEIARLVADGTLRGLSVDIAVSEMEIAYRADVVDEDGRWQEQTAAADDGEEGEAEEEQEAPSLLDVIFGDSADTIFVVRKGIIGAATVCPFPAFADARIEVGSSLTAGGAPNVWTVSAQAGWRLGVTGPAGDPVPAQGDVEAPAATLTASAAGLVVEAPPGYWFDDPQLDELTPLTVDEEGRVFGHAAPWDQCHIGLPGGCTTAPASETNYAYFLLKEVLTDDGGRVPVGTVTLDTGHAAQSLGRAQATRHYDDTGVAVADVAVGEDDFGIWVAGALRPDADADKARKLRGAALSGDWRDVNGNLELVALLAVNVPGFPVPRPTAALVASGDGFEVATLLSNAPVTAETIEALAARHRQDEEVSRGFAELTESLLSKDEEA